MSTFIWQSMFYVLVAEVLLVLVLCLPLKASWRVAVANVVAGPSVAAVVAPVLRVLFFLIVLLGFDAVRTAGSVGERLAAMKSTANAMPGTLDDLQKRYFRAQRNTYITGFALLLLLVLRTLVGTLRENVRLQAQVDEEAERRRRQ